MLSDNITIEKVRVWTYSRDRKCRAGNIYIRSSWDRDSLWIANRFSYIVPFLVAPMLLITGTTFLFGDGPRLFIAIYWLFGIWGILESRNFIARTQPIMQHGYGFQDLCAHYDYVLDEETSRLEHEGKLPVVEDTGENKNER